MQPFNIFTHISQEVLRCRTNETRCALSGYSFFFLNLCIDSFFSNLCICIEIIMRITYTNIFFELSLNTFSFTTMN